jgi:hypothetical protein
MSYFFFKNGEKEGKKILWGGWGVDTSGRREDVGKGHRMVNMVEILCIGVCKWKKMIPVETIPGMERGG